MNRPAEWMAPFTPPKVRRGSFLSEQYHKTYQGCNNTTLNFIIAVAFSGRQTIFHAGTSSLARLMVRDVVSYCCNMLPSITNEKLAKRQSKLHGHDTTHQASVWSDPVIIKQYPALGLRVQRQENK